MSVLQILFGVIRYIRCYSVFPSTPYFGQLVPVGHSVRVFIWLGTVYIVMEVEYFPSSR